MAAEHAPAAVDDLARPLARAAVARQERRAAGAGEEAEVLRVGLGGDRQPGLGGERPHLRLGQLAEREAHAAPASPATARTACRPGPWPGRRRSAAARPRSRARSGRWRARRPRARRRTSSIASSRTWPLQPTHGFGVSPAACPASHGSTTPARNSSRRSSVKCGMPIPCASERATRTACAEQHDASASLASSAHSSSVTATALAAACEQRGHRRVDAAAHGDQRAAGIGRERGAGACGRAQRAVQRVGGQLGGVQLARRQPAELVGDRGRADARGVEHATRPRRARPPPSRRRSRRRSRRPRSRRRRRRRPRRAARPSRGRRTRLRRRLRRAPAGACPFPRGLQVLGEALGAHAPSVGGLEAAQRPGRAARRRPPASIVCGRRSRRATPPSSCGR